MNSPEPVATPPCSTSSALRRSRTTCATCAPRPRSRCPRPVLRSLSIRNCSLVDIGISIEYAAGTSEHVYVFVVEEAPFRVLVRATFAWCGTG